MRLTAALASALLALSCVVVGCTNQAERSGTPTPTASPADRSDARPGKEAVRFLNAGIALLEQHRFAQAADEFRKSLATAPNYLEARVNLAIALAADSHYPEAESELQLALSGAPNHPTASYMLGLLHKYAGEREPAIVAFERVLDTDPADVDTLYNLAVLYRDMGELERSITMFERVIEASPYFLSAYYALGQACLRLGQQTEDPALTEKGRGYLERFQALSGGIGTEVAGLRYGEQGRYALAVEDASSEELEPIEIRFTEVATTVGIDFVHRARVGPAADLGGGVLVYDVDSDGDDDVLLSGASDELAGRLYVNDGAGRFVDGTEALGLGGFAAGSAGVAAGDVDNDGVVELLLGARLLRRDGDQYVDVTRASGVADGLVGAASHGFVDLDHDGDLDIVAAVPGAGVRTFRNAGDGSFEPVSTTGMEGDYAAVSISASDLDLDRDVDLVVGVAGGTTRLFANNRDFTFTDRSAAAGLIATGETRGVSTADLDGDGWPEVLVTNGDGGHELWRSSRNRTMTRTQTLTSRGLATGVAFVDFDLDGDLDLALGDQAGARVFLNHLGALVEVTETSGLDALKVDIRGLASGDVDGDGDVDLVANVYGGPALVLRNDTQSERSWVKLTVRGRSSNVSGFGTKVEVRATRVHQKVELRSADGFLSQSSGTLTFGLGDETTVDRARLLWPGGVLQAEVALEGRSTHAVEELDRKGSSCPFLWGWDGERVVFISDFQGGSPLGLWVAPGFRNYPDSDEWLLLPPEMVVPRDGAWELRATESLEEIAYLDRAMLRVIDAPSGVRVMPNERLLLAPPFVSYGLHFIGQERPLIAARDHDGRDVTATLAAIDRDYTGALRRERFRGYAEPWSLELDFGQLDSDDRGRPLVLLLHGYVEFSNSTPMYAASQAGLMFALPQLDILGDDGSVVHTITAAGAPAGLPKWMALELDGPLPKSGRVRLRYRTNMEVYFDHVLLGVGDPSTSHSVHDVEAAVADLDWAGYPTLWSPDGGKPELYRYDELLPDETWQSQEGAYTRLGDVRPLLREDDDLSVIMSHGDELLMRFPTDAVPPLAAGFERHLVLFTRGYAKDLDGHSAAPLSVGPLPHRAMKSYPYEGPGPLADPEFAAELERWSTRYVRPMASTLR